MQQEQVLALISAGSTIADAAQSAGIHRNTIHNWLRSVPDFQHALEQARQAKAVYWQEQAEQLAADALATIRTLMTDPKTPASTRLKAAQLILNLATNPPKNTPKSVHKSAQGGAGDSACDGFPGNGQQLPGGGADVFAGDSEPEPANVHNSAQPYRRPTPKIGRNELCPCGSGRKFKYCCLNRPVTEAA